MLIIKNKQLKLIFLIKATHLKKINKVINEKSSLAPKNCRIEFSSSTQVLAITSVNVRIPIKMAWVGINIMPRIPANSAKKYCEMKLS